MSYLINVMLNNKKMYFHVSIHRDSKNNTNIGVRANYAKARYAYNNVVSQNRNTKNEQNMESGLSIALINTNINDWTDNIMSNTYARIDDAHVEKSRLINHYESLGYKNVGVKNIYRKAGSGGSTRWHYIFPQSMPQKKINEKLDFIQETLSETIPESIKRDAYYLVALTDTSPTVKHIRQTFNVNYDVNNLASLFHFVRTAMLAQGYKL